MPNDSQLNALGLKRDEIEPSTVVPPPSEDVGEGGVREWALAGIARIADSSWENLRFVPMDVPAARAVGAQIERLEQVPHVFKISLPEGLNFKVMLGRADASGAWVIDQDDPSTVLLDLQAAGAARIALPGGAGIVAALHDDGAMEVWPVKESGPGGSMAAGDP